MLSGKRSAELVVSVDRGSTTRLAFDLPREPSGTMAVVLLQEVDVGRHRVADGVRMPPDAASGRRQGADMIPRDRRSTLFPFLRGGAGAPGPTRRQNAMPFVPRSFLPCRPATCSWKLPHSNLVFPGSFVAASGPNRSKDKKLEHVFTQKALIAARSGSIIDPRFPEGASTKYAGTRQELINCYD